MGQRYFITNTDLENIFELPDVSADQGCPESGRSDWTFCPDFRNRYKLIDNRFGHIWTETRTKDPDKNYESELTGPELQTFNYHLIFDIFCVYI